MTPKEKNIRKKEAALFAITLFMLTFFATTVYAQCPCEQHHQTEIGEELSNGTLIPNSHWWDEDGDGSIDPPALCSMVTASIEWLEENNPYLYWQLYSQYAQSGDGGQQGGGNPVQGGFSQPGYSFKSSPIYTLLLYRLYHENYPIAYYNTQVFGFGGDNYTHPLNETFTLYELQQWCELGYPEGLIWSLIAPGLLSCIMGCVGDTISATAAFATAIILFMTGIAFPVALLFAGFSGVEYGIAIACYEICLSKY